MQHRLADHAQTAQQAIADTAAAVSVGSAGYAWLGTANDVAQFVASVVAILAGSAAAWWHLDRVLAARKARREENTE